jgi:hypothetical protein
MTCHISRDLQLPVVSEPEGDASQRDPLASAQPARRVILAVEISRAAVRVRDQICSNL